MAAAAPPGALVVGFDFAAGLLHRPRMHSVGRAPLSAPARWVASVALLLLLGLSLPASAALADEPRGDGRDARCVERDAPALPAVTGPLVHPAGPGPMRWRLAVGLELEVLPLVLMEAEFRYLPSVTAAFELGLPHGFGAEVEATALVVDNHFALGPSWSVATGPLTWGVRDLVGFTLGWVGVAAFDTFAWGLSNEPGFTLGVEVDDSFVTLNVDVLLIHRQQLWIGDWSVVHTGFYWAGVDSGLTVETPVGGGLISYGVELSYAEADQLLWFAFSDNPTKLLITRFRAGYEF